MNGGIGLKKISLGEPASHSHISSANDNFEETLQSTIPTNSLKSM